MTRGRMLIVGCLAAVAVAVGVFVMTRWPAPPVVPTTASLTMSEFSFVYPAGWRLLSEPLEFPPLRVDAVIGTGAWRTGCRDVGCNPDHVDVSDGRVVVKVYRLVGGPVWSCRGDSLPDRMIGPNPVRITSSGPQRTFEIPLPGAEFGQSGNVFFEITTLNDSERASAEVAVGTFRWSPGQRANPVCAE